MLTFLRFFSIFLVLLLLINPKFNKVSYFDEKPNLIIAVDNSESIAYLNQDQNVAELIERLKQSTELNEAFNVEYYSFGKSFREVDSLNFDERQSDISQVFDRLSEVYSNSVSPTVLISDGNQTFGNDYQYLTNRFKQSVFPVILGDTITYTDLRIEQLNVNRYVYLKNKFPIEIIATYSGNSNINTSLKITSGSTVVYSQPLTFSKTKTSEIVSFTLPANRVGIQSFKAEIVPIENEKNKVNNVKDFAVEVIDQKTNVAIVSDILHPDLGAFKKAIESNQQRKAEILNPNTFLNQSNDFQMIVVYQPTNSFKQVFVEINRLKLNSFIVAGPKTNWSLLHQNQNHFKQQVTLQKENYLPVINQNYNTFIIDALDVENFPPITSEFGELSFSVPYQTLMYKSVNGTQLDEPLLVTYEIDSKREAVLFGEGIWKWRAQNYLDQKSFNSFDNFIGKIVQYLSSKQRRTRLSINYESFYNGNDDVKITAQYFNKNYEFDANTNLNIQIKNKLTNATTTYPFVLKNTNYEIDLSGLEAGDYDFTVSASNANVASSGSFKVLDYNVEQQFLNANVEKLTNVAENSNGNAYFIDNTANLVSDLVSDSRFKTVQKSSKKIVPLIDWKYLLGLLVLSLALEWFIRKYNGLI
ncbi:VWA domain-containing protein [Psychroserpens sp. XS_ASV72]|uniref:VWA domain-containing protein n=1 Tax=Psychroserpens sp. XS_ASV72 TaxID=3241293 RepID=UPI00351237BB